MALRLNQLRKQYVSPDGAAVPVIDIELFALGTSEQVALVGGSGTGKTTLLHLIAGILAPDGGQTLFAGAGAGKSDSTSAAPPPAGAAAPAGQAVLEYRSPKTAADAGVD